MPTEQCHGTHVVQRYRKPHPWEWVYRDYVGYGDPVRCENEALEDSIWCKKCSHGELDDFVEKYGNKVSQ